MEKRILPNFKSEGEEAKWWFENQEALDKDFAQAASEGRLGRGTAARLGGIPTTTIRLDPSDIALAREQASQRGLKYQTYLKMLVHEALLDAKTSSKVRTRSRAGSNAGARAKAKV
jgi:predicted DNA binding CopG/RHH family protein